VTSNWFFLSTLIYTVFISMVGQKQTTVGYFLPMIQHKLMNQKY